MQTTMPFCLCTNDICKIDPECVSFFQSKAVLPPCGIPMLPFAATNNLCFIFSEVIRSCLLLGNVWSFSSGTTMFTDLLQDLCHKRLHRNEYLGYVVYPLTTYSVHVLIKPVNVKMFVDSGFTIRPL